MADNSFKALMIAFILVAVFIIAMVNVALSIGSDNDSDISILDNPVLNSTFGGLETDLEDAEKITNESKTSFETEGGKFTAGLVVLKSIISSGLKFMGILFGVVNLIFASISLRVPKIVIGAIFSLLIVSVLLYLWRLWKQGE